MTDSYSAAAVVCSIARRSILRSVCPIFAGADANAATAGLQTSNPCPPVKPVRQEGSKCGAKPSLEEPSLVPQWRAKQVRPRPWLLRLIGWPSCTMGSFWLTWQQFSQGGCEYIRNVLQQPALSAAKPPLSGCWLCIWFSVWTFLATLVVPAAVAQHGIIPLVDWPHY